MRTTLYPARVPASDFDLARQMRRQVQTAREAGGDDALVFTTAQGHSWTQSRWGARRFRPAAKAAGWPTHTITSRGREVQKLDWTWHSLRHRFAAWLLWERDASPPMCRS